ncbi:MAG: hypothetical protein R6U98_03150 [Pirellulaceae bacterium]
MTLQKNLYNEVLEWIKWQGEAREPVEGKLIRLGSVQPTGRPRGGTARHAGLGTDEETRQQWLRVTPGGVGMTEEVIKNYLSQIGNSYYRSPKFHQGRAPMKVAGIRLPIRRLCGFRSRCTIT